MMLLMWALDKRSWEGDGFACCNDSITGAALPFRPVAQDFFETTPQIVEAQPAKTFSVPPVWLSLAAPCSGKALVITTRNKELVVDYFRPKFTSIIWSYSRSDYG